MMLLVRKELAPNWSEKKMLSVNFVKVQNHFRLKVFTKSYPSSPAEKNQTGFFFPIVKNSQELFHVCRNSFLLHNDTSMLK